MELYDKYFEQFLDAARWQGLSWAYYLSERPFIAFDTETTGLDKEAEMVQISVVGSDGGEVLNTLVKPTKAVEWPKAQEVHGISPADVELAPTIEDIWPKLRDIFSYRMVTAYNLAFDLRILSQSISIGDDRNTKEWEQIASTSEWSCAMENYALVHQNWNDRHKSFKWVKLVEAAAALEIPVEGAHDALWDTRMTVQVVQKMAKMFMDDWSNA